MSLIAEYMTAALKSQGDESKLKAVCDQVKKLCDRFPIYPEL